MFALEKTAIAMPGGGRPDIPIIATVPRLDQDLDHGFDRVTQRLNETSLWSEPLGLDHGAREN